MSIDKGELSVERECDMSVLIRQTCTESDVIMSQCVLCLSGLRRILECCTRLIGTLQGIAGVSPEKGICLTAITEDRITARMLVS